MFENPLPGELVETAPPRVTLRNAWAHPYDSAIAAARTCYAPRLIGPEEITDKQRINIGAATFYSGHHTVYQHAHFEFGLENISRQFVWSFLHAHPFYNSEQQSQRYVRLDRAQAYIAPQSLFFDAASRAIYEHAIARAWQYYRELSALLVTDAREILSDIWHVSPMSHPKRIQKIERSAEKRSIEIARYVLPLAAFTTMVHTVSGIVLHRLWRMSAASDTPSEARAVIGEMVTQVRTIDPQFFDRFGTEPLEEMPEWADRSSSQNGSSANAASELFAQEFDAKLEGKTSKLVDYSPNAPRVMAEAYRAVIGQTESQCSDAEAIDRLLNPARNLYRLETLNVGVHAPTMRALQHANYTFAKKISHTADSAWSPALVRSSPLPTPASPTTSLPCSSKRIPARTNSTTAPCKKPGLRKMSSSTAASPRRSPSTFSPTPNPSASSNPARSCISSTSGPCAPASTPRKKFTEPR